MALRHLFLMLYWWEWLAYAFAFFTATWFAIWIVKSEFTTSTLNSGTITESDTVPTAPLHQTATLASRWLAACLVAASIWASGYGYRDHQLTANTRTYIGVSVLSQQSDRRYQVHIPGYVKSYDWEFCHPLKMPSPVIDIKYEQRYGCKVVNGVGFVSPHKENTDAQLSPG